MSLSDWLLPREGRLSRDDVADLSRIGALLPAGFRAGLIAPARSERRALPRFEAVAITGEHVALSPARVDALFAVRLVGYGSDAERAFRTALRSCRLLCVLDGSRAPSSASQRLLGECALSGGRLRLYRGDLTDPLLRIDDYPTGVRPILEDLSSLHDVLRSVDDSGLAFHLGIVPAILEDRMETFLRSLSHLIVSMHGFEHGYAKFSKLLLDAQDPFNERGTVGGFDEFKGQNVEEISQKLGGGRQLLEARTGQRALSYIPPTNLGNRDTARALEALGFEYVLSERPMPGCNLPCIASTFYERSNKLLPETSVAVASLHATWEADLWRQGDTQSLPRFLQRLLSERERGRSEVAKVAERVLSGGA